MPSIDLAPLLKLSSRLLDLHDSRRGSGESPQYQTEDRPGLGDGRYIALAEAVLDVLQRLDARTGDEFSSLQAIQQGVREQIDWAEDIDVEYVLNVLSSRLPLKPEYAKAVADYCVGGGSRDAAVAALKACFVDPTWMMGWFAKHPDDGDHFSEWVREPARKAHVVFEDFRQLAESLRSRQLLDQAGSFPVLSPSSWGKQVDSILERVAAAGCLKFLDTADAHPKAKEIISACPGLSLSVLSYFSVWRDPILFSRGKNPKQSAFVDSLHSMYAPYVDVFRSDQGMSHHAKALLQGNGTEVVSTLRQLPEVIARRIAERQNPS